MNVVRLCLLLCVGSTLTHTALPGVEAVKVTILDSTKAGAYCLTGGTCAMAALPVGYTPSWHGPERRAPLRAEPDPGIDGNNCYIAWSNTNWLGQVGPDTRSFLRCTGVETGYQLECPPGTAMWVAADEVRMDEGGEIRQVGNVFADGGTRHLITEPGSTCPDATVNNDSFADCVGVLECAACGAAAAMFLPDGVPSLTSDQCKVEPTQSPSQSPTQNVPTQSPSQSPTQNVPTQSPSQSPTQNVTSEGRAVFGTTLRVILVTAATLLCSL